MVLATQQFTNTVSKTNEWLKGLEDELHENNRQKAYLILRCVLHALRDRLTVEEAADLGAQLPMLVRGFYYEGWRPAVQPRRIQTQEEFLSAVKECLGPSIDPGRAVHAVFNILQKHIAQGEINDIKSNLPRSLLLLWNNGNSAGSREL